MNHLCAINVLLMLFFTQLGLAAEVKIKPNKKSVALTFDDGPDPRYTQLILDVLAKYEVKATFFVLGQSAKSHPELIKAIKREGHSIANHSYSHANLKKQSKETVTREIRKTNEVLEAITGQKPKCLRPPYGALNPMVRAAAKDEGLEVVTWDLNSFDYTGKSPAELTKWVLSHAKAGADILMHDSGRGGDRTSKALAGIIEGYKNQNIGFDVLCE